jgi:endogenous inhibitor of DNA gyrase (YacG/DUF329 family)
MKCQACKKDISSLYPIIKKPYCSKQCEDKWGNPIDDFLKWFGLK